MIVLLQRVTEAQVSVGDERVSAIGPGILALACVEPADTRDKVLRMADRVCAYRIFDDESGRMNLSLRASGGELLAVSQFTLAANTRKGLRPGFSTAADPELARRLFSEFCQRCRENGVATGEGRFGAHMRVALVNDGPVTFWLNN